MTAVGAFGMPQHGLPVTCDMWRDCGQDSAWSPRRSNRTLTPPPPPKLLSSMAAAQDVEHRKMSLNSCVDGLRPITSLIVTYHSSPGPSTSQNSGRGWVDPFFFV